MASMYAFRTRIKKDIVCEFLLPAKKISKKVIILCGGMPSFPGAKLEFMQFLSKKGYWVFAPRYRGSWESGGEFLKISPDRDVAEVCDVLSSGFKDLWSKKIYKISNPEIYVIGSSFGGAASILSLKDKRVKKAVAISPVVDWRKESKSEPMDFLYEFVKNAFGRGYNLNKKNWDKLKSGDFFNPISKIKLLDPKKLLIIYTKDDKVVNFRPTKMFSKNLGCETIFLKRGGHLSLSCLMNKSIFKRVMKFLKN